MGKHLLLTFLILVLAVSLTACGGEPVVEEEPVVPVAVKAVGYGQVVQQERVGGKLAAQEQVNIVPQLGGKIEAVNVSTGDFVEAGQVLVRLETSDLEQQIRQAEAGVEVASAQLNRALAGAGEEELIQLASMVSQAETAVEAVLLSLNAFADDFSPAHQQVLAAEAQYRQARLAREQAENQLYQVAHGSAAEQVEMGVDQARKARELLEDAIESMEGEIEQLAKAITGLQTTIATYKEELEGEEDPEKRAELMAEIEAAEEELAVAIKGKMELEASLKNLKAEYELSEYQVDSAKLARRKLQLETLKQAELAVEQAEAAESAALAQLQMARKGLTQQEQLILGQKRQAEASLEAAKARLKQAEKGAREEDLAAAEAAVKQAKAALALARSQLEKNVIRAPIAGQAMAVTAQVGELAGPSMPLLTIVNGKMLKVEFNLTQRLINTVAPGDEVKVLFTSMPDREFTAVITAVSPAVDPRTGVFPVEAVLDNSEGMLRPGIFADVQLVTAASSGSTVVIPAAAILNEGEESYVYIVKDGRAVKQLVTLGLADEEQVEVLTGLAVGDQLVYRGQHYLEAGMKVRIAEGSGGATS
ncbi:MAG: efflux RND transporter periplasmic adaptor subunit [bacterium]|jgi:RND family efflux transporter MFP subunit